MILFAQTTWGINEIINLGISHYGFAFVFIIPIILYVRQLLNNNAIDVIRQKMINKISIPNRNNILLERKYSILSEIDNITYTDSKNKTKMLKELCRLTIEKTYTLVDNKSLNSETIITEYKNTKEDFKTFLKTEFGESKGNELYEYVIPIISREISVLIFNLTTNIDMFKIDNIEDRYFIDTLILSYIKSIVRKFEFGFYQFNGHIDYIINNNN